MQQRLRDQIENLLPLYLVSGLVAFAFHSRWPWLTVIFVFVLLSMPLKQGLEIYLERRPQLAHFGSEGMTAKRWAQLFYLGRIAGLAILIPAFPLPLTPLAWPVRAFLFVVAVAVEVPCDVLRKRGLRREIMAQQRPGEEVVADCMDESGQFALYLRGFSAEREQELLEVSGHSMEGGKRVAAALNRPVEWALINSLGRRMPVVGLRMPGEPDPLPGIYRYKAVPREWRREVRRLAGRATHVVVWAPALTEGVIAELKILVGLKAERKSMVIVRQDALETRGAKELLSKFPYVIREVDSLAELLWDGLPRAVCRRLCLHFQVPYVVTFTEPARPLLYLLGWLIVLITSVWVTSSLIR
jgi:hypothetical protein